MKFYKLTEKDLPIMFEMSESELKVYCWLSVNLPFDDSKSIEIDTSNLAEQIGISRRSIQRAILSLKTKGIFDIEITKAKVKRMTTQMSDDTDVAKTTQMSPKRHRCRQNDTDVAETTQMSRSPSETSSQIEFQNLQTNQTYKDFKDSLSEGTRENFLKFVSDKTAHFQFPIINMDDYLSSHDSSDRSRYLHYWSLFQSQNATNSHLDHDDKKLWTKKQWIKYLGPESKLLQWSQLLKLHGMKWCMGLIPEYECFQEEKLDRMNFRSWEINYKKGKIDL